MISSNQKKLNRKEKEFPSQLRFDLANKDWVVVATARAKRPKTFYFPKRKIIKADRKNCPFRHLTLRDNILTLFSHGKRVSLKNLDKLPNNWTTLSMSNKYPAFLPHDRLERKKEGNLYEVMDSVGFSEVVITRSHTKPWAKLKISHIKEVLDVFQIRYKSLMSHRLVNYISIFQNHGPEAGASLSHPHSQIMAIPVIDADLRRALNNSKNYFKRTGRCLYCTMNGFEEKHRERLIFENKNFLALCPFASKAAFEVIISPKKHLSYFERITEEQKWQLAEAFKVVLSKLYKGLNNPPYNFYLRTAPCDGRNYDYYHWHWTIIPRTSIWAGFEMGAKIEISTIKPEEAAAYLRKQ